MELQLVKGSFYLVSLHFIPEFCQNVIAPIINLYSVPFLTKSYNYILETMSSNSFWATFRPILLNFVKTFFFFFFKVQPPFCHFCTFIDILPILKNQGYRRTHVQTEIMVPSRGMHFQKKINIITLCILHPHARHIDTYRLFIDRSIFRDKIPSLKIKKKLTVNALMQMFYKN